jgi:hypothetical protein
MAGRFRYNILHNSEVILLSIRRYLAGCLIKIVALFPPTQAPVSELASPKPDKFLDELCDVIRI